MPSERLLLVSPLAHITEIEITGLLGRRPPIAQTLDRNVNIFFGPNGCGKTTLLKVLAAALERSGAAIDRLPVQAATVDIYSIAEKRVITHTWTRKKPAKQKPRAPQEFIVNFDDDHALRFAPQEEKPMEWQLNPAVKSPSGRWAHRFLPTTRLYLSRRELRPSGSGDIVADDLLDSAFADAVNRAWLEFYSRVLQQVREIQERGLQTVLKNVLSPPAKASFAESEDPGEKYERVRRFLNRQGNKYPLELGELEHFRKRYVREPHLRTTVDNLNQVEQEIEAAMVPVERFTATIKALFNQGKSVTTDGSKLTVALDDGQVIELGGLSSGEKHLIRILLTVMTAGENTVLIDEPELSMHIDWQRTFVEHVLALNPDCQLILASHSPEIMADVSDSKIFRL